MTRLTFFKNNKHFVGFRCEGHSDFADEGYDIVCAAVSSTVQFTVSYLTEFFYNDVELIIDEQNALIELRCVKVFEDADRILSILDSFSKDLSEQYSDYFTFDYLEV